jgi:hypothetical protein
MTPESAAGLISLLSLLKDLGAFGILGFGFWLLLDGRLVTRGHLNEVVAAERQQALDAKAREAEWKRLATRGTDEIIPPLAVVAREHVREQVKELRGQTEAP